MGEAIQPINWTHRMANGRIQTTQHRGSAMSLLHILLERIDPSQNMARYYVLSIEPTLFGDSALVREWGRIGVTGFGGPPTHIRLLRDLCVTRRGWIDEEDFERLIETTTAMAVVAIIQLFLRRLANI